MKIKLYPKELLEAAWKQDKKLYAHGDAHLAPCHLNRTLHTNLHCPLERAAGLPMIQVQ